jgi:hypothetical protein
MQSSSKDEREVQCWFFKTVYEGYNNALRRAQRGEVSVAHASPVFSVGPPTRSNRI